MSTTTSTLFFVSLDNFSPLDHAVFVLAHICHKADMKVSRSHFTLTVVDRYRRYVATLYVWDSFFVEYSVHGDVRSRIYLPSLRSGLGQAREQHYPSMAIHMKRIGSFECLFLQFPHLMEHELRLWASQEEHLDQIQIDYENYFKIASDDFRHILREVSGFPDELVTVIITNSHVKFYIQAREIIILNNEAGRCQITGYEGEAETRYRIFLQPTRIFHKMLVHSEAAWFHKTLNSNCVVIAIPTLERYVDYVIHFPHM